MELPSNPDRTYINVKPFSQRNGLSERYIRNLVSDGTLPHVRLGRRILIPSDAMDFILQRGQ